MHREMNRMFDDVLRGFDLAPFGPTSRSLGGLGWARIDIDETDKEMRISAELPPGLDENGVLSISGEKKTESEDKARRFSERYYGRFERRISLQDIEEDKATAAFKNGVLTVSVPKSAEEECPPHRDKPQWLTLPTFGRSHLLSIPLRSVRRQFCKDCFRLSRAVGQASVFSCNVL